MNILKLGSVLALAVLWESLQGCSFSHQTDRDSFDEDHTSMMPVYTDQNHI